MSGKRKGKSIARRIFRRAVKNAAVDVPHNVGNIIFRYKYGAGIRQNKLAKKDPQE